MRFQERSWRVRHAGSILLAIFILLGLSGVFSRGVLSAARAERDGLQLSADYERFQRRGAQTQFALQIPKQPEDEIWLRLGPAFQDTYDIEAIQPPPARSDTRGNGINLYFEATDADIQITIRARPRRFGAVNVDIARYTDTLQVPVLIYP